MVQGFDPFAGLDVALHRFPERRALPPAALGADDKVQAGWMRCVGPALNVDVLCGQEVECGAYARGRRGHAGAGDDPGPQYYNDSSRKGVGHARRVFSVNFYLGCGVGTIPAPR